MAPIPRRPGVDAEIVQASFVRGFDSPLLANPAEDLVLSTGKNLANNQVSRVILWNRTDAHHPLFEMRPGAVLGAAPRFEFYAGILADPNGQIAAPIGSLYLSNNPAKLWQNQDGLQTWKIISDDSGGENLAETLAIGNFTGGNNIVVSPGDKIQGQDSAVGPGGPLTLLGGAATAAPGAGGDVLVGSGSSAAGTSGKIELTTAAGNGSNSSGLVRIATGDATGGAPSGNITLASGASGAVGLGGSPGFIALLGGTSEATGPSTSRGGSIFLRGGRARTDGEGGSVTISAGISSNIAPFFPVLPPVPGRGGNVSITAAASASAQPGGSVSIGAGTGGPAGGAGGSIFLSPGSGGGGGPQGTVQASGVFTSTNWLRGNGDPNGLIPGEEGYIYQQADGGQGAAWVNTNGSINGWAKLALSGSLVDTLSKAQQGWVVPSGSVLVNTDADRISDVGLFKGIRPVQAVGGTLAHGAATAEGGAFLNLLFEGGVGSTSGLDMSASLSTQIFALEHGFLAVFKFRNTGVATTQRMFMGYSTNDTNVQLSADAPAVGQYVGLVKSGSSSNWFFLNRGGLSFNLVNTGVSTLVTSTGGDPFYYILDGREFADSGSIRHIFLDKDFVQLATFLAQNPGNELPFAGTRMGPVLGGLNITGVNPAALQIFIASIVTEAAALEGGGGGGGGTQTLEQTLQFGNETGLLPIIISQGSSIVGETDGDGGSGSPLILASGPTTIGGNNTGIALLTSGNLAIAGSSGDTGSVAVSSGSQSGAGATGNTGPAQIASGPVLDGAATGNTGLTRLASGSHFGTGGNTGTVEVFSGRHLGSGGTDGDVHIAPGSFSANPSTPGLLDIRGGSTTIVGVTGGSINVRTGSNTFSGNTGDLTLRSADVANGGDAGTVYVIGGDGGSLSGRGGSIQIDGGDALGPGANAIGGSFTARGGDGALAGGGITLTAGLSTAQAGPDITITAGNSSTLTGGNISLTPGTGPGGDGEVIVNGKLTVTGLIDPTGLLLDGQAAQPTTVGGGQGLLWVDQTAVPSVLKYTDDTGTTITVGSGGSTSLASLTDVNLVGPVIGEVLTYNGAAWVNLAGAGGSPLSTILALGNTTGANDIVVNSGQQITAAQDLVLTPGTAPGRQIVLDGLRWPEADGLPGTVLTTDGAGNLLFAPGGGGSTTFAQALARLQAGYTVPRSSGLASCEQFGIFELNEENHAVVFFSMGGLPVGPKSQYGTAAVLNQDCGLYDSSYCTNINRRSLSTWKVGFPSTANAHRLFVGLSAASPAPDFFDNQLNSDNPGVIHVGLAYSSDLLDTVYRYVIDIDGSSFQSVASSVAASAAIRHLEIDLVTLGQVTLRILDENGVLLDSHTFVATLGPTQNIAAAVAVRARTTVETRIDVYSVYVINQAYLIGGIGGSGTQTLSQVLFFGNQTGGQTIQGDNNALGSAGNLDLAGGSSTGAGGNGGDVNILGGSPDPGGAGDGGTITLQGANGAPGGDGSNISILAGNGSGAGDGGDLLLTTGTSDSGNPGSILVLTGSAAAGNVSGGNISLVAGNGVGTGNGGGFVFTTGTGGAGGGDGGPLIINLGAGGGGGSAGTATVNGDVHITGKLTVDGLIDPPGLLMTPSVGAPFTPAPGEGGIWVNLLGELIFTNNGGDLNLSDLAPSSGVFLDAFLLAAYGLLSPGSVTTTTPQSSGVLGNSAFSSLNAGGSKTLSFDSEGSALTLSTAAAVGSHAAIGTQDLVLSRNQRLRTRIKFQSTSATHTDERIFVGLTTDLAVQIAADDPVANEYAGLRKSIASNTFDFVARGPGGAITPVVAYPVDTDIHYLDLDFSDTNQVRFILYASDATTVQATSTVLTGPTLPALTTGMQLAVGVGTDAGTVRSLDFYFGSLVTRADLLNAILGGGSGVPDTLAATLLLGNSTGSSNIVISTGQGLFGESDLEMSGGQSVGTGQPAAATFSGNSADDGGTLFLSGGSGGTSGSGGGLIFSAGSGASSGSGGSVAIAAGAGGNTTGTGGDLTLTAGNGGPTNGAGGSVTLAAGQRGGSGVSGTVIIRSGTGSLPSTMSLLSGASSTTGQVQLYANTDSSQTGGGILLGRGAELSGTQGGYALLMGGTGTINGGTAGIFGGSGLVGGGITIQGGTGSSNQGGGVTIRGGTGTSAAGGSLTVQAGTGVPGGATTIAGGNATTGSGGNGGSVFVRPGTPDGGGSAGVVQIGPNSGTSGEFRINGIKSSSSTGIQCGMITINAAASSTTVSFGTTMASVPVVVVTPVKGASASAISYWADSISTVNFVLRRNSTADGSIPICWIAMAH